MEECGPKPVRFFHDRHGWAVRFWPQVGTRHGYDHQCGSGSRRPSRGLALGSGGSAAGCRSGLWISEELVTCRHASRHARLGPNRSIQLRSDRASKLGACILCSAHQHSDPAFDGVVADATSRGHQVHGPKSLAKVLGCDLAPEVKTLHRKLTCLAAEVHAAELGQILIPHGVIMT